MAVLELATVQRSQYALLPFQLSQLRLSVF